MACARLLRKGHDRGKDGGRVRINSNGVLVVMVIERLSFECRKVIGFALSTLRDWLKRIRANFSSKQK